MAIEIKLDAVPSEIAGSNGRATGVVLKDATRIAADLIVAGIGVLPNIGPAQEAGLETDNGIVVDAYLRTGDPCIYAIGDCAAHPNPFAGSRVRIESVQNAVDQAVSVAAAICGEPKPYWTCPGSGPISSMSNSKWLGYPLDTTVRLPAEIREAANFRCSISGMNS